MEQLKTVTDRCGLTMRIDPLSLTVSKQIHADLIDEKKLTLSVFLQEVKHLRKQQPTLKWDNNVWNRVIDATL